MFELYADKVRLNALETETITSGSVNACQARFQFSDDWAGLERTAVFMSDCGESRSVRLDSSGMCAIPWEVLVQPGYYLFAGVYGRRGEEIVLPTVWANLGLIQPGAEPGEESKPPTPELWWQELERKGDTLGYTSSGQLGLYAGEQLLSSVPVSGAGGGPAYGIGHGLRLVGGDLTVETTEDFSGDNTLPMTAAGVETVVGNIEALLGTI